MIKGILRVIEGGRLAFHCPGCKCSHSVNVDVDAPRPRWSFNGNFERPTFQPSISVRSGYHMEHVCHSFVTDGQIQFLNDCTHDLAGQTVELTHAP